MTLKEAYEELKNKTFPSFSQDDRLAEWILDLAEVDGYVTGIAISVIEGDVKKYPDLEKNLALFRNRLEAIQTLPDKDKQIYDACIEYLNILDRVVNRIICAIAGKGE